MQIAVCDDEKEVREYISEKIKRLYPRADLLLYPSGDALLLSGSRPDILLLDIGMAGKDGMETAREFRKKNRDTILIFITAWKDFVFEAFDVGAFHYLVKPFENKKFIEVMQNAVCHLEEQIRANDREEKSRLMVTAGGEHITVNIEDIVYAEVFDRKIILHTMETDIEYYGKMKELEEKTGEGFYRPHRAYLVNFRFVKKYDARTIYLEKGQALMAKKNYQDFVKCYLKYNSSKYKDSKTEHNREEIM